MNVKEQEYTTSLAAKLQCSEDEALGVVFASFKAERRAERVKGVEPITLPRGEDGRLMQGEELEILLAAFSMSRIQQVRDAEEKLAAAEVKLNRQHVAFQRIMELQKTTYDRTEDIMQTWNTMLGQLEALGPAYTPAVKQICATAFNRASGDGRDVGVGARMAIRYAEEAIA